MKSRVFLLAAVLVLPALALYAPVVASLQSYSDDFETDATGFPPEADWYETAGVTGSVIVAPSPTGGRAVKGTGTGLHIDFDSTESFPSFCEAASQAVPTEYQVSWAFRITTVTSISVSMGLRKMDGTAPSEAIAIGVPGTGTPVSVTISGNSGSATTNIAGLTIAPNVWYEFSMADIRCAVASTTTKVAVGVSDTFGNAYGATVTSTGVTTPGPWEGFFLDGSATAANSLYIDNLTATLGDPLPTAVGAAATSATFTTLSGFSIDRTGTLAIVRTDSFQNVRTLSGVTLADLVSPEDTDCTRPDTVLAQNTPTGPLVMYLDCQPGGNPDTFKIRSAQLTQPTLSGCGVVCSDIDSNEFESTADDDQTEFAEAAQFPIDFSQNSVSGSPDLWKLAWAWSGQGSRAGEVGIALYTNCQAVFGCDDEAHLARVSFAGTTDVADDICTGNDGSGFYMAVADALAPTKIYPVAWSNFTRGGTPNMLDASIGTPAQLPVSGGLGVACGSGRVAVNTATQVSVWPRLGGGSALWSASCTCDSRGVAMSNLRADGSQYVAWLDGSTWYVAYANNGTKLGSGTFTPTTFTQTEMDSVGTNLYIASNNVVVRFPISAVTGSVSIPGSDPVPTSAGTPFSVPAIPGVSEFGGNLLFGAIMVVGMTVTMGAAPFGFGRREFSTVLAMIGAVLGFFMAWGFGYFNTAVVFGVIVLGGAGFYFFRRSRSEA